MFAFLIIRFGSFAWQARRREGQFGQLLDPLQRLSVALVPATCRGRTARAMITQSQRLNVALVVATAEQNGPQMAHSLLHWIAANVVSD